MKTPLETSRLVEPDTGDFQFERVNRERLARYLEVPSVNEIDEITSAEIDKLDARRSGLLTFWKRAVAVPIDRIDGAWIELEGGIRIHATTAYGRQLERNGADWLVVGSFTVGGAIDAQVKQLLENGDLFEAFVLKQWAATMTEQARAWLTLALCGWADHHGRSLMPHSGPGYNGWPLEEMSPLMRLLNHRDKAGAAPAIRVTDSSMLLPLNSMLIVHGATPRRAALSRAESLAQCHRCAMRNCRYRVVAADGDAEPEIVGVAR